MFRPVYAIDEIPDGFDYIIIANSYVDEIHRLCQKRYGYIESIFLYGVKK